MTPLYIKAQEVRSHIERLRINFPDLAEDVDAWTLTLGSETDLFELLTRIVREEREAHFFSEAIGTEITTLLSRRDRFNRKNEALRSFMKALLETAGQHKVQLPTATLSMSKSRPTVIITNESELPDEYVRIKREPNKQDITAALVAGQVIPGATLNNAPPRLVIRQA